jgi:hypothetical protein
MDKIVKFFSSLVSVLFENISPELRDMIQDFVKQLYEKAKKTSTPFDDLLVKILASVFGVTLEE